MIGHFLRAAPSPLFLALGGLLSLSAAMGIGRFVYTPILPFMAEGTGLSADDAGLIASANFLGYLMGALAGSMRSLGGKPRTWFLGALLASALTTALMGMAETLWTFLLLRFLGGFASAFVLVFSSSLVLDRLRLAGRSNLSALHFAGVGCGIAFSALLINALGQFQFSWNSLWLASGAATLLLLILCAALIPSERHGIPASGQSKQTASPTTRSVLQMDAALIRLVIAYGLFGFGYVITATFVSVLARSTPGLQSSEPYVWLLVGLFAAPSIFFWNAIAARIGARRAFALACAVEALGVSLTVLSTSPILFLGGAALLGGTFMGITALGLIEARAHVVSKGDTDPRRILAIMTASFGLGQMAGPWFAGELYALTGSFVAPSLCAAAALIVAAALVFFKERTQECANSQ